MGVYYLARGGQTLERELEWSDWRSVVLKTTTVQGPVAVD